MNSEEEYLKLIKTKEESYEALKRYNEELLRKIAILEDEIRMEKAKQLQIKPDNYPFWHESQNTNTTYQLGIDLHNQQEDFNKDIK